MKASDDLWVVIEDHETFITFLTNSGNFSIYPNRAIVFNKKQDAIEFSSSDTIVVSTREAIRKNRYYQMRYS